MFNDFNNAELMLHDLLKDELSFYSNGRIKVDKDEDLKEKKGISDE
jgi:hypothetical protein